MPLWTDTELCLQTQLRMEINYHTYGIHASIFLTNVLLFPQGKQGQSDVMVPGWESKLFKLTLVPGLWKMSLSGPLPDQNIN